MRQRTSAKTTPAAKIVASEPAYAPISSSGEAVRWVIPPHQSAKVKRAYDTWVYRERHLVECCFNKLKHFRRIFSRCDKLDRSFLGFVQFVCALV